MKSLYIIIVLVLVIGGFFYWYQASKADIGSLNIYQGNADILRKEKNIAGRTGSTIKLKDTIRVAKDSRVSIVLKDGSVIRLEAGSEVGVSELEYNGTKIKKALFDLRLGRLWSHVEPLEAGGSYNVQTPTVVATIRGTIFNVDYIQIKSVIYVDDHEVGTFLKLLPENFKVVSDGNVFYITDQSPENDFNKGPSQVPSNFFDSWIKFNQKEDSKLDSQDTESPSSSVSATPSNTLRPSPSATVTPCLGLKNCPTPSPSPAKKIISINVTYPQPQYTGEDSITIQFKAIATYNDQSSADITNQSAWSVTGTAKSSIDNYGLYKVESPGTDKVTATYQGVSNFAMITTR